MIIYYAVLLLFGLGLFFLARQGLELVTDLMTGLAGMIQRRLRPFALRQFQEIQLQAGILQPEGPEIAKTRNVSILPGLMQWRLFWIAGAALAALLLNDSLRSPLAIAVILTGGELYRSTYCSHRLQRMNEDASNLIVQFASRYPISRSLVNTLRNASKSLPGGEVRRAVEACLARLATNQKLSEAMMPLQTLKYPALERFARLLADVQDTNQDVFTKTLDILRAEVESRMDLHRQARQSLTLIRGTTRILQAVVVAAMTIACVLPNWRYYFTSSEKNWFLFIGMIVTSVLGSLYVEVELRQLET